MRPFVRTFGETNETGILRLGGFLDRPRRWPAGKQVSLRASSQPCNVQSARSSSSPDGIRADVAADS
jgi:hypothetical protein